MDETTATSRRIASRETADLTSLGLQPPFVTATSTSETYTTALLQRARALAELNAFITLDEAAVLAAARDADKARAAGSAAPLLGVPLGVKDSYLTKGLLTSLGLDGLAHFVPREDADAVRAIKGAGALVFGNNNLVEMSYGLTGHNARYGPGEKPARPRSRVGRLLERLRRIRGRRHRTRVSGGRYRRIDPGARIALWRGGVQADDRAMAAWPRNGVAPISHTLDTTGVFARSVEDCTLIDQVVTGRQAGKPTGAGYDVKGARLAYAPRQFLDLVDRRSRRPSATWCDGCARPAPRSWR